MEDVFVGIDVGTTKVCALVGRMEEESMRVLGVGIQPSEGIRKGIVIDLAAASQAIKRAVEQAQRTSGLEITSALVSLAGAHVSSINSRGSTGVPAGVIDYGDIQRAFEQAQAVAIPHDREIVHIIQRGMTVDGQGGIRSPIGMRGYKLEVETHIITAAAATMDNLRQCVGAAGVEVQQFVLNPLASGEAVLTEHEREMGVAVCDIGGGTTDLAIYVGGEVWHTMVLAVGGNHLTQDIMHGLRLSLQQAEEVKKQYGYAVQAEVDADEYFSIRPFGEEQDAQISRRDLAHIIEARVDETFRLILQEIKRSGYDGLLPAGMVLTGGTSALPGIKKVASAALNMPVRAAQPEHITGLTDKLNSPAYSTSVGLLQWAAAMSGRDATPSASSNRRRRSRGERPMLDIDFDGIKNWMKRLLP
ncbi:MAG: cell division protein FtsA [Anaerolineales bacterium]